MKETYMGVFPKKEYKDLFHQYDKAIRPNMTPGAANGFVSTIRRFIRENGFVGTMHENDRERLLERSVYGTRRWCDLNRKKQSNERASLKKYVTWLSEGVVYYDDNVLTGTGTVDENLRNLVAETRDNIVDHLWSNGYWNDRMLLPVICLDDREYPGKSYRKLNFDEVDDILRSVPEILRNSDIPDNDDWDFDWNDDRNADENSNRNNERNLSGFSVYGWYDKKTNVITLCYETLRRIALTSGYRFEHLIGRALAHEMFHCAHYQICGDNAVWDDVKRRVCEEEKDIIIESLAEYYSYRFCKDHAIGAERSNWRKMARDMYCSWIKYLFWTWPYAKAVLFEIVGGRRAFVKYMPMMKHHKVFEKSLNSIKEAIDVLYE